MTWTGQYRISSTMRALRLSYAVSSLTCQSSIPFCGSRGTKPLITIPPAEASGQFHQFFLFFFQTLMRCPSPCLTSLTHFLIIAPVAFACLLFMHATFHIIDNSPNLCVLTLPSTSSKGLSWNLRLRFQMVKALRKIMKLNFGHFLWSPHSQIPLDWFMRGAP